MHDSHEAKEASSHSRKASSLSSFHSQETECVSMGHQPDATEVAHDGDEAAAFWESFAVDRISSESESESDESESEPGRRIWKDKDRERFEEASVLLKAARLLKIDVQTAVVEIANAGSKRGTQQLLTNFWTPEKSCRLHKEENVLAAMRGSRGPVDPAFHTAQERTQWQKKMETQNKIQTLQRYRKQTEEQERAAANAAEQRHAMVEQGLHMAVDIVAPITPKVAIQLPKQAQRGRGRPRLSQDEVEHRLAQKRTQGKAKKVHENCRILATPPCASVRQKATELADVMAIYLGSSLTKGHWNSQVPPKQPLVIPGCSPNHVGPTGQKIPRNLFFVGFLFAENFLVSDCFLGLECSRGIPKTIRRHPGKFWVDLVSQDIRN